MDHEEILLRYRRIKTRLYTEAYTAELPSLPAMREAESLPTGQQLDELEREGKSGKEEERELQTELEELQEDNEEMLSIRKQCIDAINACRQFDRKFHSDSELEITLQEQTVRISELERTVKVLEHERDAESASAKRYKSKHIQQTNELHEAKKKIEKLESEVRNAGRKSLEASVRLENAELDHQNETQRYSRQFKQQETSIQNLEQEKAGLVQELEGCREEKKKLGGRLHKQEQKFNEQIENLKSQIATHEKIQQQTTSFRAHAAQLQTQLSQKEKELHEIKATTIQKSYHDKIVDQHVQEIHSLKQERHSLKDSLDDGKNGLRSAQTLNAELKEKVGAMEQQLSDEQNQSSRLREELDTLKDQSLKTQSAAETASRVLMDEVAKEMLEVKDQLRDTQQDLEIAQSATSVLKAEKESAQTELEKAKDSFEGFQSKIADLETTVRKLRTDANESDQKRARLCAENRLYVIIREDLMALCYTVLFSRHTDPKQFVLEIGDLRGLMEQKRVVEKEHKEAMELIPALTSRLKQVREAHIKTKDFTEQLMARHFTVKEQLASLSAAAETLVRRHQLLLGWYQDVCSWVDEQIVLGRLKIHPNDHYDP